MSLVTVIGMSPPPTSPASAKLMLQAPAGKHLDCVVIVQLNPAKASSQWTRASYAQKSASVAACVAAGANMQRFSRPGNTDGFWAANTVFSASRGLSRGPLQISTWPRTASLLKMVAHCL